MGLQIKGKPYGFVEPFKARLIAQGYNQQEGIDFDKTFSPVVKATTFRTIIYITVSLKWSICQLDVKNPFLYGVLSE